MLPSLVLNLDVDQETAQSRVTGDMDAGSLMSKSRTFALNSQEVLGVFPPETLRVTIDASGSAENTLAQCEERVKAVLN